MLNSVRCIVVVLGVAVVSVRSSNAAQAVDPRELVTRAADAVLRDFPQAPPFNWGEGVMLTGMMRAHELTGDPRYLDFVRRFADHWHRKGIEKTLNQRGYCGHWGPGFPMLMLKAWAGLSTQLDQQGRVIGVSAGTGPSAKSEYQARQVGTYTWGTGAFLLAACVYAQCGL